MADTEVKTEVKIEENKALDSDITIEALEKVSIEEIAGQANSVTTINHLDNYLAKIAWLDDPHINYRKIGYAEKYPEFCLKQFDDFITFCIEEKITDVVIAGDLWDGAQNSQRFIGKAFKLFRKLMKAVKHVYYMRGNHEYSSRNPYTMFELTLDAGIFEHTNLIQYGNIKIHLHDFGTPKEDFRITDFDPDSPIRHIGTFHENIVDPDIIANQIGKIIAPAKTDVFYGYELGIVAHVHTPLGLFESENSGWTTQWYVAGSQGRTQYKEGQIRDSYIVPVVTIDQDGNDYEFEAKLLPLVPCSEFFNLAKILEDKKKKIDLNSFTASLEDVSIDFVDAADEIANMDSLDDGVKEMCYRLLNRQPSVVAKKKTKIDEKTFAEDDGDTEF